MAPPQDHQRCSGGDAQYGSQQLHHGQSLAQSVPPQLKRPGKSPGCPAPRRPAGAGSPPSPGSYTGSWDSGRLRDSPPASLPPGSGPGTAAPAGPAHRSAPAWPGRSGTVRSLGPARRPAASGAGRGRRRPRQGQHGQSDIFSHDNTPKTGRMRFYYHTLPAEKMQHRGKKSAVFFPVLSRWAS